MEKRGTNELRVLVRVCVILTITCRTYSVRRKLSKLHQIEARKTLFKTIAIGERD